jgi:hypothetical protein
MLLGIFAQCALGALDTLGFDQALCLPSPFASIFVSIAKIEILFF